MFKDKKARKTITHMWKALSGKEFDWGDMDFREGHQTWQDVIDELDKKFDLILDHLKLEYVPETEKKEPAKLVEKTNPIARVYEDWIVPYMDNVTVTGVAGTVEEKPKRKYTKKRKPGRPKKK